MSRHPLLPLLVAVALAAPPVAQAPAQVRVGHGRALDSNLRLGSGGFNSHGRAAIGRGNTFRLYHPLYAPSRTEWIRRNQHNAFLMNQRYHPARPAGNYHRRPQSQPTPYRLSSPVFTNVPSRRVPESALPLAARQQTDEISYGIGFYLGLEIRAGLEQDGVEVDFGLLILGFMDGLLDRDPIMSMQEVDDVLAEVHDQLEATLTARLLDEDPEFKRRHDDNLERSRSFHNAFKDKEGVVTLPSGVQYKVIRPGTGPSPEPTDVVLVNVRVSLIDGTAIGEWRGAEVRVDRMVAAGAQLLPRMKVGAYWQAAFPPHLAFGAAGRPPEIGPNETIVAEVELLAIK